MPIIRHRIDPLIRHLRASEASNAEACADLFLRRMVPVAIYVDATDSRGLAEIISERVKEILSEEKFEISTYKWGPYEGSHFQTLFGETKEPVTRKDFRSRLARVQQRIHDLTVGRDSGWGEDCRSLCRGVGRISGGAGS